MKKFLAFCLVLILCTSAMMLTAAAEAPAAGLSGPDTVRSGNTITLDYTFTGTDIVAVMGTLHYDADLLTLISAEAQAPGWKLSSNGDLYMAEEDNQFQSAINGQVALLRFTFQVLELAEGTPLEIRFAGVTATSLAEEFAVADSSYTATISRPLSGNSNLSSLTVGNATLSPAFDPSLTRYNVEVPFSVTHLDLGYAAADPNATVSVYNPDLEADKTNTITVTVTAENGSVKEYVILATRGKDPNYEPSGNNSLNNIVVEEFRLSPVFDPAITSYLIWLPYEVDHVSITGIAQDNHASITVEGGSNLVAGADNEVKLTCTAENGDRKVYTIIVKRAPAHDDPGQTDPTQPTDPTDPSIPTEPTQSTPESSAPQSTGTQPTRPTNAPQDNDTDNQRKTLLVIMYCALGLLSVAGIVVCVLFVIASKKEGKYSSKPGKDESNKQ